MSLTFDAMREANVKRCREAFPTCANWSEADWLMALTGEVGELANLLKKIKRGHPSDGYANPEVAREECAKELADIQTYLDLLAAHLQVDLGQATISKFNEVSIRVGSKVTL